jgi:hypothetical protein
MTDNNKMLLVDNADLGLCNWSEAENIIRFFNKGGYKGYSDWRLPLKNELIFIYNNENKIPDLNGINYWTDSENVSYNAWKLNMVSGESFKCNQNEHYVEKAAVRLVRGNSKSFEEFQVIPDSFAIHSINNYHFF